VTDQPHHVLEAILFASRQPVPASELRKLLPGSDVDALADRLRADYAGRGLLLSRTRAGLSIRTAPAASDLAGLRAHAQARLSRPALETLACIAAFEEAGTPLTRSEIERVRGVGLSPGIIDALLAAGYVRTGKRRESRGRPLTWLTTEHFHDAYGLNALSDLPAYVEMRDAGLAEIRVSDTSPEEDADDSATEAA
jgi:segregation and condensation protein B